MWFRTSSHARSGTSNDPSLEENKKKKKPPQGREEEEIIKGRRRERRENGRICDSITSLSSISMPVNFHHLFLLIMRERGRKICTLRCLDTASQSHVKSRPNNGNNGKNPHQQRRLTFTQKNSPHQERDLYGEG